MKTQIILLGLLVGQLALYTLGQRGESKNLSSKLGSADKNPVAGFDHTLHVVISAPKVVPDVGQKGEIVEVDALGSHTHEPGQSIVKYAWTVNGRSSGTGKVKKFALKFGKNKVCLKITDKAKKSLSGCQTVKLVSPKKVPGVAMEYFLGKSNTKSVGGSPDATEIRQEFGITGLAAASPPYVVRMKARLSDSVVQLKLNKPLANTIFVNGKPYNGKKLKTPGGANIDVRVKVNSFSNIPFLVLNNNKKIPTSKITFDSASGSSAIVINQMAPTSGSGGTKVTLTTSKTFSIKGAKVLVRGKAVPAKFSLGSATFTMPKGSGSASVQIVSGKQKSNKVTFQYLAGGPSKWAYKTLATGKRFVRIEYCYGYIFAAEYAALGRAGTIQQFEVLPNYSLRKVRTITTVVKQAKAASNAVLGLTCDPFGSDNNFRLYISHSKPFQTSPFKSFPIPGNNFIQYHGYLSYLSSTDNFGSLKPVISGLPVSNWDHGVNGGDFLPDGTLLIGVGSMTNAGYPGTKLGGLPESPLAGCVIQAKVRSGAFPVNIRYSFIPGQKPSYYPASADPNNAIYGDAVKPSTNAVSCYATGLRNPYDCAVTMRGTVWCTDNGANIKFGVKQEGCKKGAGGFLDYVTSTEPKNAPDELNRLQRGAYYGSPNMARVRMAGQCTREGKYTAGPSSGSGVTNPSKLLQSSSDGIVEYVSNAFGGSFKNKLFVCKYNGWLYRLSSNGQEESQDKKFPCLDLAQGPGGALYGADFGGKRIQVRYPTGGSSVEAYDVLPLKGKGGTKFKLSGKGFTGGSSVKFGGQTAKVIKVLPTEITGVLPGVKGVVDVTVNKGGRSITMKGAYRGL